MIDSAVAKGTGLTRQLLSFARRPAGEASVLDLNELVRNMQRMLGRLIGEHIEVELRFDPGVPPVLADPANFTFYPLSLIFGNVVRSWTALVMSGPLLIAAPRRGAAS